MVLCERKLRTLTRTVLRAGSTPVTEGIDGGARFEVIGVKFVE